MLIVSWNFWMEVVVLIRRVDALLVAFVTALFGKHLCVKVCRCSSIG